MGSGGALSEQLFERYPVLAELPAAARAELLAALQWLELPAGAAVFDERQACPGFPFVVRGSIRVSKSAPSGRELALYRVAPGGSCIITTGCLLGASAYNARGVAESETLLALLPAPRFAPLLQFEAFRRFVFALFADRIAALMQLIEEVAFRKLDQRLAALLLQRGPTVRATHQQLADELGSVREIVSRLLKGFAEQGLVALQREHIDVLDADALRRQAGGLT
jgi:CRP/FNR family transcriptional regulator